MNFHPQSAHWKIHPSSRTGYAPLFLQELAEGKDCVCGTVALDSSGSDIVNMVGNKLYEQCRAGHLQINNFPQFDPILTALKAGYSTQREQSFRVSVQKADSLLILESLARKWVDNEGTAIKANEIIALHNQEYNSTQEMWLSDTRSGDQLFWFPHCFKVDQIDNHTAISRSLSFIGQSLVCRYLSARTAAADPAVDDQAERPAKRIKVEPTMHDEVSKLKNPILWHKLLSVGWNGSLPGPKYEPFSRAEQDVKIQVGFNSE